MPDGDSLPPELVAKALPVSATIGGGSTIGRDAPAGQLTVARARQASIAGWKRPQKAPKGSA